MAIPEFIRLAVTQRAGHRCEYCQMPMKPTGYRFHIDHILPRRFGGTNGLSNLALACQPCNAAKHVKHSAKDPRTGKEWRLYNPRIDHWSKHFRWSKDGAKIFGRTAIGRVTVIALNMNEEHLQEARRCLPYLEQALSSENPS